MGKFVWSIFKFNFVSSSLAKLRANNELAYPDWVPRQNIHRNWKLLKKKLFRLRADFCHFLTDFCQVSVGIEKILSEVFQICQKSEYTFLVINSAIPPEKHSFEIYIFIKFHSCEMKWLFAALLNSLFFNLSEILSTFCHFSVLETSSCLNWVP